MRQVETSYWARKPVIGSEYDNSGVLSGSILKPNTANCAEATWRDFCRRSANFWNKVAKFPLKQSLTNLIACISGSCILLDSPALLFSLPMKFAAILQILLLLGTSVWPENRQWFVETAGGCGAGCQCATQKVKTNTCCCRNNPKSKTSGSCCLGRDTTVATDEQTRTVLSRGTQASPPKDRSSLTQVSADHDDLPPCCRKAAAKAANATKASQAETDTSPKSCCAKDSKIPDSPWGQVSGCPCGQKPGAEGGLVMPRLLSERVRLRHFCQADTLTITSDCWRRDSPEPVTPPPKSPVC